MSEQWTTERAAADPAGALAWCESESIRLVRMIEPDDQLEKVKLTCEQSLLYFVETAALRALVRELAAATVLLIERPGTASVRLVIPVLAKVPADLKE